MNEELPDVAAMALVRGHVEAELHRADERVAEIGAEEHRPVAGDGFDDAAPPRVGVVDRERPHEAHRGAAGYAVDEDLGEREAVAACVRRRKHADARSLGPGLRRFRDQALAHSSSTSFSATVVSAL